jgi:hypothetical protein
MVLTRSITNASSLAAQPAVQSLRAYTRHQVTAQATGPSSYAPSTCMRHNASKGVQLTAIVGVREKNVLARLVPKR